MFIPLCPGPNKTSLWMHFPLILQRRVSKNDGYVTNRTLLLKMLQIYEKSKHICQQLDYFGFNDLNVIVIFKQ